MEIQNKATLKFNITPVRMAMINSTNQDRQKLTFYSPIEQTDTKIK